MSLRLEKMKESIVQIQKVDQAFRSGFWMSKKTILSEVDFEIKKGKIFGLLGANGAGKTTLINLIVGIRKPVVGQVLIEGVAAQDPRARVKLGYLPERPYFHDYLTGDGLLRYVGALCGLSGPRLVAKINEVLDLVNMKHAQYLELKKYSKGMLQRIGIAQAISHEPKLLILDEPMSGLDPVGRREIRELIVRLNQAGASVIFSSHILSDIETICHEVGILKKGKLMGVGTTESFLGGDHQRVEISVSESPGDVATLLRKELRAEVMPDTLGSKLVVQSNGELNEQIKAIIECGLHIRAVSPYRGSLEDYFKSDEVLS